MLPPGSRRSRPVQPVMTNLIVVENFVEGGQVKRSLAALKLLVAQPGATYSIVEKDSGSAPQGLALSKQGDDLSISLEGRHLLLIGRFFEFPGETDFVVDGVSTVREKCA